MSKRLITESNLAEFCTDGVLYVAKGQIVTPGARDKALHKGIQIIHGVAPKAAEPQPTGEPVVECDVAAEHAAVTTAIDDCAIARRLAQDSHMTFPKDMVLAQKSVMMPSINLLGPGCLEQAAKRVGAMGHRKGLIVTDAMLNKVGMVQQVVLVLEKYGIATEVYDGVQPNPSTANVNEGLLKLRKKNCDFVISLGGGSPHDCAKAIALLSSNGGTIADYEGVDKSTTPALPLVAINTTAGTASEMTRFCIITNEETKVKMAIVDPHVTPAISVNDPNLMLAMPASLTAATGMDALTHAIEAFVSTNANPFTDAMASKAIKMMVEFLPRAVEDGSDLEAREQMACAQFMAGVAFNNAGLGYVHAMAHQLGGMYGLPHGVCNAVLLPHVMAYNMHSRIKRMSDIARYMGCDVHGKEPQDAAIEGIKLVCRILTQVNMPTTLTELGVKAEDIPAMAANAMKDACALTNPTRGTQADIERIFQNAM
ncbi:iron-containing alcohol dehydrogenase [Parendozoicomonas haliclonae]|uniref:iron-containing alcohol dehydrogenase n=1 Tax=Parendozoicomonas haliclonae TaxID=1960125 RepID=UPI001F606905|nr:iron-containing alcohol dehydrogenase [Parendozoicomonas haliclonae]